MDTTIFLEFLILGSTAFLAYKLVEYAINIYKQKTQQKENAIDWTFGVVYVLLLVGIYLIEPLIVRDSDAFERGLLVGLLIHFFKGFLFVVIFFIAVFFNRKIEEVEMDANNEGFRFKRGARTKNYVWGDFTHGQIDNEISTLILKGNKKIKITSNYHRFYRLVRSLPKGYAGLDYSKISGFFENLKSCKICGSLAVQDDACLDCGCSVYDRELDQDHASENAFIMENQLDVFCVFDENEPFHDFKQEYNGFDLDPNWKPLVTKKDVLDYSKKHFWDSE